MSFPVKLLLTWNIRLNKEETYAEFFTHKFLQVLQDEGLRLTDAWSTKYGNWPQIQVGFRLDDVASMERFLQSEAWLRVKEELLTYVSDYHQKVVKARGGFQF